MPDFPGFKIIKLETIPPRKEHLTLTQTKGSRLATNRKRGGKKPKYV